MDDVKQFTEKDFNASNHDETCLWCGCELDRKNDYRENGFFCSLRCGFQFGYIQAINDLRLEPQRRDK